MVRQLGWLVWLPGPGDPTSCGAYAGRRGGRCQLGDGGSGCAGRLRRTGRFGSSSRPSGRRCGGIRRGRCGWLQSGDSGFLGGSCGWRDHRRGLYVPRHRGANWHGGRAGAFCYPGWLDRSQSGRLYDGAPRSDGDCRLPRQRYGLPDRGCRRLRGRRDGGRRRGGDDPGWWFLRGSGGRPDGSQRRRSGIDLPPHPLWEVRFLVSDVPANNRVAKAGRHGSFLSWSLHLADVGDTVLAQRTSQFP